ncbi:MAG: hypothetical protein HQ480_01385 [Candidatus Pelagibacter sp.]|jgi:hypothetical protein|nr:hypothetical protein [Candidatus Pelagibacter sp.]|tara:strand:+ start:46 stop:306 length:261 start_codon:yes stop_codon:yes gene_type:complete
MTNKLDTWLDKAYKISAETATGTKVMWGDGKKHGINQIHFNKWLGTPKYENGLDILFKLGYTPEEALVKWAEYNPINKKWGKKKNV